MKNPFEAPKYLAYYGLREAPYSTNPDERYLYLTPNHRETIDMVGHIIENREGAGLIVGEQGTGKTTIMRRMASLMNDAESFRAAIGRNGRTLPYTLSISQRNLGIVWYRLYWPRHANPR
jgi:hypothetical protein